MLDVLYNVTRLLFPKHPVLLLLNDNYQLSSCQECYKEDISFFRYVFVMFLYAFLKKKNLDS